MITVFTSTFNRCHSLTSFFYSLQNQIFKDFVGVIVDEGAIVSTKYLIEPFQMKKSLLLDIYTKKIKVNI